MANQTVQQRVNRMRNRASASAHETVRQNRAVLELLVSGRTKYIKFLLSTLRERDLAEEIFQQLIIKIPEWKSQLRSEDRAEAWIYRVLRNAVIDHHRRSSRGVLAMQEGGGELEIAAPEPTPALCPCAPDQLVKLKAEYQDALSEVTMAGNSVQAYAAERNISSNLAYVRLHRARHSLRERLVAVCGSCAGSGSLRVHLLNFLSGTD
jgi:DNA-directed RNA polymerase specialized sigma24 family protein